MLLVSREGNGTFHKRLASLLSCLLPAMMEQATKNPYPILSRPFFSPPSTPAAGGAANSSSSMPPTPTDYPDKSRSIRRRGKKGTVSGSLETLDVNSSSIATPTSHRSRNMASPQPMLEGGVAKGKSMKRSVSNDATLSMAATPTGFQLPSVVLVLPVQEKNVDTNTVQWDFDLLSEEEVGVVNVSMEVLKKPWVEWLVQIEIGMRVVPKDFHIGNVGFGKGLIAVGITSNLLIATSDGQSKLCL